MGSARIQGRMATDSVRDSLAIGEIVADESIGQIVRVKDEKMARLMEADPDPHKAKFVTVEIRPGKSNNNRHWSPEMLQKVADQINSKEPLAYKGHPFLRKDFDKGADFPDPQTLWLGAVVMHDAEGMKVLAKGYNLTPEIRRNLQTGAVNSISICGDADLVARRGGGYDVEDFNLLSMDWARKDGEGMSARVVALTGEQTAEDDYEGSEIVKPEDIAGLTEGDLRRHNPNLVADIEKVGAESGTKTLTEKIGEMEKDAEAAKPTLSAMDKIRELLKLNDGDDVIAKIGEVLETARGVVKAKYDEAVEKTLGKIKDEDVRGLVKSLVGEMDEGIEDPDEAYEAGKKKVDELLDTNEHVKKVVGEMLTDEDEEGERKNKPRPHSLPSTSKQEKKDTENIERTKISV